MNFYFYSPICLEPWYWETPWTTGIGGSETSHIALAQALARRGHYVESYTEVPPERDGQADPWCVWWHHKDNIKWDRPGIYIIYREPLVYDTWEPKSNQSNWFIAQDVDYQWTPERRNKVGRYICLCREHVNFTLRRYPDLSGRMYRSSNGIFSDQIRKRLSQPYKRNPNKLIWSSSPDRGLLLVLQQWQRIKDQAPDAELHIFYGFNNMEEIEKRLGGPVATFSHEMRQIQQLMEQDGVHWRGRVNQTQLIEELLQSNIWPYYTDWPETSCITAMETQATGVVPITNRYWALADNIFHGVLLDGIPQIDTVCRAGLVHETIKALNKPWTEKRRKPMIEDTLDSFDWNRIAAQWENWAKEDYARHSA